VRPKQKHQQKQNMKSYLNRFVFGLLALLACLLPTSVQAAAASASGITATATTAFEAVSVLVVAMVGFFIIVRIVKGIRK